MVMEVIINMEEDNSEQMVMQVVKLNHFMELHMIMIWYPADSNNQNQSLNLILDIHLILVILKRFKLEHLKEHYTQIFVNIISVLMVDMLPVKKEHHLMQNYGKSFQALSIKLILKSQINRLSYHQKKIIQKEQELKVQWIKINKINRINKIVMHIHNKVILINFNNKINLIIDNLIMYQDSKMHMQYLHIQSKKILFMIKMNNNKDTPKKINIHHT